LKKNQKIFYPLEVACGAGAASSTGLNLQKIFGSFFKKNRLLSFVIANTRHRINIQNDIKPSKISI
jgi:hypothetical protein